MSVKGKVQVQATLVSIKEMAGWTFYGCLVCAGLMLVIPWRKRNIKELDPRVSAEECECEKLGKKVKARKADSAGSGRILLKYHK